MHKLLSGLSVASFPGLRTAVVACLGTRLVSVNKVRRGYSDGGVIPTVVLISPAYCGVRR